MTHPLIRKRSSSGYEHSVFIPLDNDSPRIKATGELESAVTGREVEVSITAVGGGHTHAHSRPGSRRTSLSHSTRHQDIFSLASDFDNPAASPVTAAVRGLDLSTFEDSFDSLVPGGGITIHRAKTETRLPSAGSPLRSALGRSTLGLPQRRRGSLSKSVSHRHRVKESRIMDLQQGLFDLLTGDDDTAIDNEEELKQEFYITAEGDEEKVAAKAVKAPAAAMWRCPTCTYLNNDMKATKCYLCEAVKPKGHSLTISTHLAASDTESDAERSSSMLRMGSDSTAFGEMTPLSESASSRLAPSGSTTPSRSPLAVGVDSAFDHAADATPSDSGRGRRKSVPLSEVGWEHAVSQMPSATMSSASSQKAPEMDRAKSDDTAEVFMPAITRLPKIKGAHSFSVGAGASASTSSRRGAFTRKVGGVRLKEGEDVDWYKGQSQQLELFNAKKAKAIMGSVSVSDYADDGDTDTAKKSPRQPPKGRAPHAPKEKMKKKRKRKESWECASCTLQNDVSEPICTICGRLPPQLPPSPVSSSSGGGVDLATVSKGMPAVSSHSVDSVVLVTDPLGAVKKGATETVLRVSTTRPRPGLAKTTSITTLVSSGKQQNTGFTIEHVPESEETEMDGPSITSKIFGGFWSRFGYSEEPKSLPRARSKSHHVTRGKKKQMKRRSATDGKYSIAQMPEHEKMKIHTRLATLKTKKALTNELNRSIGKLEERLKKHAATIMKFEKALERLRKERAFETKKWDDWHIPELQRCAKEHYDNSEAYYSEKIKLERLHISCFTEKLTKLKGTVKKVHKYKSKWSLDDMRQSIEGAFHVAWKIRLSNEVPEKQALSESLKKVMRVCAVEYRKKKDVYGSEEVNFEERKVQAVELLRTVIYTFESERMAETMHSRTRSHSRNTSLPEIDAVLSAERRKYCAAHGGSSGDEEAAAITVASPKPAYKVSEDDSYFHRREASQQSKFDSFLLDRRCKEGRIIGKWLAFIKKKNDEIEVRLEDLCDFMVKLSHTFLDSYGLSPGMYFDCVRIFCFRCILQREAPKAIVRSILDSAMGDLEALDDVYCKKVMWMKVLKNTHLDIPDDYWFDPRTLEMCDSPRKLRSVLEPIKKRRVSVGRLSQVAFKAGGGLPFAEAINLLGEIEKDTEMTVDPDYALHIILEFVKIVYSTAIRYCEHNMLVRGEDSSEMDPLGNDELFPVILYCTIQSRLEHPNKWIHFIENILPEAKTTMGQGAFSLSVMKAAVQFISCSQPTSFGLDADIEIETW